ncbi:hypothetical protein AV530_010111 [Patagioenas fasciata monilis]|uniref:Uncharacterized protein n=1 Tax=Patagioenas fasciata monilis TaxID=372326 RepID=A0A1V4L0C6_PATFA|nr:hypothetical protein AV530_010111 [Patagioenas fasciata monilis]
MDRAIYIKLIPLYLYGFACSYSERFPCPGSPVPVSESYEKWHLGENGLLPCMLSLETWSVCAEDLCFGTACWVPSACHSKKVS